MTNNTTEDLFNNEGGAANSPQTPIKHFNSINLHNENKVENLNELKQSVSSNRYINTPSENKYEFKEEMQRAGIQNIPREIIPDSKIHRFSPYVKKNKDGWYVFFGNGGAFGDWSKGINEKWSVDKEKMPPAEWKQLTKQIENARKTEAEEQLARHNEVACKAQKDWDGFAIDGDSNYLTRKKVDAFDVRYGSDSNGSFIAVPMKDVEGKLCSYQKIYDQKIQRMDTNKLFLKDGRKKGCFHIIGSLDNTTTAYVAEGYSTAATIHMATGVTVITAFDAGSIDPVIESIQSKYPNLRLVICGDDDRWKDVNTGREKADVASNKYGCSVVFPKFKNTEIEPTDFNDLHCLEGLDEVKRQLLEHETQISEEEEEAGSLLNYAGFYAMNIKEFLEWEIPPRNMILSPIIPEQGLVMLYAQCGIGKTHVSLAIACVVAAGAKMYSDKWSCTNPYKVLFVDGEMSASALQARIANIVNGEELESNPDNLQIITPDRLPLGMCIPDLSTNEGQQFIERHLEGVKLLILDNLSALCRTGKENESESWIPMQGWFLSLRKRGISVLMVHHANKNGGQRGTSKKEDLLDTVIELRRGKNYNPEDGARFEVHYTKNRGFFGDEAKPFEAWLITDENGKAYWKVTEIEDSQLEEAMALSAAGMTQRDIAKEMDISPATVNRLLKKGRNMTTVN